MSTPDHHGAGRSGAGETTDRLQRLCRAVAAGPCLAACASGRPVLAGDAHAMARWPGYSSAVCAHGLRAVFARRPTLDHDA